MSWSHIGGERLAFLQVLSIQLLGHSLDLPRELPDTSCTNQIFTILMAIDVDV